ncbi:hypothetical protein [Formosa algae]|uniref:DUF3278 domain-containing protein n=1 Tax=Formosa algae TaxID=225843 RepID=A0A9X1CCZ4_9FLAO|nr:hypothetical protein [Formosa algae]MBP1840664.1 hypothetical protein [Formosa algae]MDQ0335923.1 hypothetical protein [Formosa algae]OEI81181.1 hypothetical protein AST99_05850 [Formosa algae]
MSSDFKTLQSHWNTSKNQLHVSTIDFDNLYKKIRTKEKENYMFYYGTITILLTTLIVISLFFYFVAPVQYTLSRIGAGLMIFGLIFRIGIELKSIQKAKHINILDNSLKATEHTIAFHKFRTMIHQVVAPIIVILYTVGFYLITPEFSQYMPLWNIVFIDVSYIVIAVILFIVIRKGVKGEMQKLSDIIALKQDITE